MPLNSSFWPKWPAAVLLVAGLFPHILAAQDGTDPPETVQVALSGFTLEPKLTDTGALVLDEAGEPVMQRIPLDESVVTPGDRVLYVITVENPTEEPASDLQLGVQVAAELLLDPYSFNGPDGLVIDWADGDALTDFAPLFTEIDGEMVLNADLDELRALRLTLPELQQSEQSSVEYTVTLR